MQLVSPNGDYLRLTIDGYQFPSITGSGRWDWDANWLEISGAVKMGDSEWTFSDPCLTTWEAGELATWLRGVAESRLKPAPVTPDSSDEEVLAFTEPCIAFSLQNCSTEAVTLRVHLSADALPTVWASNGTSERFVEFSLSPGEVAAVAGTWAAETRAFPERP